MPPGQEWSVTSCQTEKYSKLNLQKGQLKESSKDEQSLGRILVFQAFCQQLQESAHLIDVSKALQDDLDGAPLQDFRI